MNPVSAPTDGDFDAAGAFSLLGDETRVAILRALAGQTPDPQSFAALREAVGVDDSGRFNYHLGKLVGTFVEKTDEGYKLTYAGSRVVGAVYEGAYATGEAVGPVALEAPCPLCSGTLELTYADERIHIGCRDCGELMSEFGFPPGAVAGREPSALPRLLAKHMQTMLERLRAGFCLSCSGPAVPQFHPEEPEPELAMAFVCERCHGEVKTSLASVLLTDSAVVSFHDDHGIDVREMLPWALSWLTECTAEQVSESPPRYAITATLDAETPAEETLRVEVDESLRVVEAARTSR